MTTFLCKLWDMVGRAAAGWQRHNSWQMAAALAFYSLLSLAPLSVLAIAVAAFLFGEQAARGELLTQLNGILGQDGAAAVQSLIARSQRPELGSAASFIGLAALFVGASAVFGQLQESMNAIWQVPPAPGYGVGNMIRQRLLTFAMVLAMGLLLIASLVVNALLTGLRTYLPADNPGLVAIWSWSNDLISFSLIFGLIALIFRFLPDVRVDWRDVWPGSFLTALLLAAGKWAIGLYLGSSGIGSTYGAAGSLVVLILWIYYCALILFFGAELTHAFAERRKAPTANIR